MGENCKRNSGGLQTMLIGIDGNEANVQNRVGVNQFAHGLLWGLWRQKTNHQFLIYLSTPPLSSLPEEKENWHYRLIVPPKFWTQWRLPLDLFTHNPKPDVFFSPSHYAPRFSPVPTVVSIMDLGFLTTPKQFTKKDFLQLREWTSYSVKNAAHLITISEFTKKDIIKNYHLNPDKISVVYPGYEKDKFFPRPSHQIQPKLKKYGIQTPYILSLGSLKPSKNIERLVEAYASLQSQPALKDVQLVIAGKKAWLYDQIFAKVKGLGLTKKTIFTGFFPEEDIPYLVSGAKVFILPSLFEGFGIPVVEALASDVPVVVSKVASLPEAAGPSAIYINPESVADITAGLKTALTLTRERREKMVKDGVQFVKKFNWDSAAKMTLEILISTHDLR